MVGHLNSVRQKTGQEKGKKIGWSSTVGREINV